MQKINKEISQDKQMDNIFAAIIAISDDKNIPRDTVADALKDAITKAYAKENPDTLVDVIIDIDNKKLEIYRLYKVVEPYDDLDDFTEITLEDASKLDPNYKLGDFVKKQVSLKDFTGLSLGLYLSQLLKHNITSQSNKQIYNDWKDKVGTVIRKNVYDAGDSKKGGIITVDLDERTDGVKGVVPRREQIPGEILKNNQQYDFYVKELVEQTKGWPVILSRADVGLVKYLLEVNIPEIQEKIIEIKDISRIAGFKTKLSVISHQPSVEPAGTIIGPRGSRIKGIQDQIHGEHIEVIEYSDNFKQYIVSVCSPAEILGYSIVEPKTPEDRKRIIIIAKSDKLALLIGKQGNNIRIISDILKANVDIMTPEDAALNNIVFTHTEPLSIRQQGFNRVYDKYRVGSNVLSGYNKAKPRTNVKHNKPQPQVQPTQTTNQVKPTTTQPQTPNVDLTKKNKTSFLDTFKNMDKDDLLNELSNVTSTDDFDDNVDDDYEENN